MWRRVRGAQMILLSLFRRMMMSKIVGLVLAVIGFLMLGVSLIKIMGL